jgi:hypothetical protein
MGTKTARFLVLLAAGAALALSPPPRRVAEPAVVRRYLADQSRLKRREISVQQLYQEVLHLEDQLLRHRGMEPTLLERLDAPAYRSIERRLKAHGVVLNRGETVFVAIEPAFFQALARRYGAPGDIEFFEVYAQMYPSDNGYIWPAYIEQQTDVSGCTSFAPHKMVDLYGRWKDYRSRFPNDYSQQVSESIQKIESQLSGAICVCEEQQVVTAELRAFLARFPKEGITPKVATRLHAIEEGRSTLRFNCLSG